MIKKLFITTISIILILWIGGYVLFLSNIIYNKKTPDIENNIDAIIVLTGGKNRIRTGLEIFANKNIKHLFITGVNKTVRKSDITSMWKQKTEKKLPSCCITLGYDASTTVENAIETKKWLDNINNKDIKTILIVTSDYHINRALLEFKNIIKNVDIIGYPVKEKRKLKDIKFWKISFSEYNKIIFRNIFITINRR